MLLSLEKYAHPSVPSAFMSIAKVVVLLLLPSLETTSPKAPADPRAAVSTARAGLKGAWGVDTTEERKPPKDLLPDVPLQWPDGSPMLSVSQPREILDASDDEGTGRCRLGAAGKPPAKELDGPTTAVLWYARELFDGGARGGMPLPRCLRGMVVSIWVLAVEGTYLNWTGV